MARNSLPRRARNEAVLRRSRARCYDPDTPQCRSRSVAGSPGKGLGPMHIELSEEQVLLRDTVRRFAAEVVKPRAKEIDESGEFPRDYFDKAAELGLGGVAIPEQYGGSGMDTISYCLVIEEISRVCATSGVILSVNNSLV